jgi:hypothetical protein
MTRLLSALTLGLAIALAPSAGFAAEKKASMTPKAGKNEKVCTYKFPDGEKRSWVCDKAVPCCAWDAIKYVKCGTTFTGCL